MRVTTAIALSAGFLAVAIVPAAAECPSELANIEKAAQSASLQDVEGMVRQAGTSRTCEPWEKRKANALLSTRLVAEARKIDPALKRAEAAALIERAAKPAVEWRSLELLGRMQASARNYRDATQSFQAAINLIAVSGTEAPGAWKNEASKTEIATLRAEADEAKMLAASGPKGVLVAASTDRAGNPGGVFSAVLERGAVGTRVPAPIRFEFDSAKLTSLGSEAAQEMATYLKGRDPKSITITGHTDHVGSESYNMDLSKRRAAAVAAFLKDNGVTARLVTVGKGFAEPWKTSPGSSYSQAEIDELNRRVEFDWN